MKKITGICLICLFVIQFGFSQNIGIGNTNPLAKLDLNGDLALHSTDVTITNTYNYALDVNTIKQSNYKLKGSILPLGNFIVNGITAGVDGRIITLTNKTGFSMELYNDDAVAAPGDRIKTGIGTTLAVYNNGNVSLQYDATEQYWNVISAHNNSLNYFGGGGGGTSYWDLTGADIKNNNSGNVGIGTSPSSSYKLKVGGKIYGQGNSIAQNNLTGGGLEIVSSDVTSGVQQINIDGQSIQSVHINPNFTLGSNTLLINPYGGNVGINYTTPLAKLFVRKTSNTSSPEGSLACFGTTYGSYFHYGATEDTYIRGGKDASKVIINDGALGNVGIGLSVPRAKLTILSNTVLANNNTETFQIAGKNPMMILSDQNGGDYAYLKGITDISQTPQFPRGGIEIGAAGNNIYLTSQGYQTALMVNGLTNNVGIGTNNPSYKLSVNGTIRSKEVIVEAANWPDYVFDKKYDLRELSEVEKCIVQNKHLPGIPSAKEIEENGLLLGDLQKKTMEKVEELTLYIIDLKKDIELLKSKMK